MNVNTDKASRGVWLVKVPRYLSEVWKNKAGEIIGRLVVAGGETTFHSNIIDDNQQQQQQSSSSATNGVQSRVDEPITVIGKASINSTDIPLQHKFIIRDVQYAHQSLAVLSEDKSGLEEDAAFRTGKLNIEGRVVIRAECQPPNSKSYMQMKVRQIHKVSQPKKTVQKINKAVVKFKPVNAHQEHTANKDKAKKEGLRAVRLEKDDVVKLLFHAFEKHQFYRQLDLQKVTNQPASIVREVLNDIGIYHDGGQYKATWELKPEYRNYNKDLSKNVQKKLQD